MYPISDLSRGEIWINFYNSFNLTKLRILISIAQIYIQKISKTMDKVNN